MHRVAVSILLTRRLNSSEVLLVHRNPRLPFFGGYLAFPGGTLEPQDHDVAVAHLAGSPDPARQDYALFVAAAARELFEETGVWLARGHSPIRPERLRDYRRQMLDGHIRFSEILKRESHYLDGRDFTSICRITTPPFTPRRYDTWFLRCQLPAGATVEVWPGELEGGQFISAQEALQRWHKGEMWIVPPVVVLLQELAGRDCESFLPHVRHLTESFARGKLHRVYCSCGVLLAPLKTNARPPATHTNAYLVGEKQLYLVDPGSEEPPEQERLWELLEELAAEGRTLQGMLLTHHHPNHVGAAAECHRRYGLPVYAHKLTAQHLPHLEFSAYLEHGQELELGTSPDGRPGWKLRVYHLPGHTEGHLAFQETRYQALIVGDLFSPLYPIPIDPEEGRLSAYMRSLQFLESVADGILYPGHGPPTRDGRGAIQKALHDRRRAEELLLAALSSEPQPLESLLEKLGADQDPQMALRDEPSLRSALIKLFEEGRVEQAAEGYRVFCSG